jgi:hypothetical protein
MVMKIASRLRIVAHKIGFHNRGSESWEKESVKSRIIKFIRFYSFFPVRQLARFLERIEFSSGQEGT